MKKLAILILSFMLAATLIACTGGGDGKETTADDSSNAPSDVTTAPVTDNQPPERGPEGELDPQLTLSDLKTVTVDSSAKHQTMESFGASGAWWAQSIGTCPTREKIAKYLFDPTEGIGLNSYRYNVGAGSADEGAKSYGITDKWRRAESFETAPGEYNWKRDKGAVWFMTRAVELGVDEVVMFANSPLERLTINGKAYGESGYVTNIAPENYQAFATYMLDVAEHFKSEGIPVKYISPINEPAFEWAGVQEGCHYEDKDIIALLKVFVEEIGKRDGLEGVAISAPEGSSWRNSNSRWEDNTLATCQKIMRDEVLGKYFTALDAHSYWSTTDAKKHFASTFKSEFPNVSLRQTEWCEMKTAAEGQDAIGKISMPSGLEIAKIIHEDLTILDCTSWSFWTAVSFGDYGDGLVYCDENGNDVVTSKRMWSLGNYSRFIDRGYTRIDCSSDKISGISLSAYEGTNEYGEAEIVIVVINEKAAEHNLNFSGIDASAYNRISVNVTDADHDLEETYYAEFLDGTAITVPGESVVTVVISNRTDA